MTAEYLAGRQQVGLVSSKPDYRDALFAAGRYENDTFSSVTFEHCTFANNSLKGSTFENCTFKNVAFLGVYFRDTVLSGCTFEGCRFIDCDLTRVDVRSSDFRFYNTFIRSYIPYGRMSDCLPGEGNLRQILCDNLWQESLAARDFSGAGRYRAEALEGQVSHLKAVVSRSSPHYRTKYDAGDQAKAVLELSRIWLFNAVWGSQRSHWVVLRNWLVLAVVAFVVFALACSDSVGADSNWLRAGLYGAAAAVPVAPPQDYSLSGTAVQILTMIVRILGLVFAAVFASVLFSRAYEGRR